MLVLLVATLGIGILAGTALEKSRQGPYVNSVGVPLPPDAAPPAYQVLYQFTLDQRYMEWFLTIYKGTFGMRLIAEPLLRVDRNFNLLPAAATHWEVSADGLTWTFHIRKGLIFSDGRPLTAHDWVFSFRRGANPKTGYDFEWYYRPIKNWGEVVAGRKPLEALGVKALDDYTLTVTTNQPIPYLPYLLSYSWVSPPQAVAKYGDAWSTRAETSIASGPFILREWTKGDKIVVEANPYYRGPSKPLLEKQVARLHVEQAPPPAIPAYEAGEVDYVTVTDQAQLIRIQTDPVLKHDLNSYIDFETYYLTMDTYHPPFNNLKVRQAFAHAIDRQALGKSAIRGFGEPAYTMLEPGFPAANLEGLAHIQRYDPELARKCLAEAGYPDGKGFPRIDMWLRNVAAGGPIKNAAEAIQAMLKQDLNIDIGVRNVENKVFMDELNSHRLTLGLVPYRYDYVDPSNLLGLWLSNGRHAWRNQRFEALVRIANELVGDPQRRLALYQEAERILVSDVGGVFLWYRLMNEMWKPYVRGEALELNQWGYRAWRGDQMQNLSVTLYITKEVLKFRPEPPSEEPSGGFWRRLFGEN